MFEPHDELSSDLEWMLESGQVEREQLAEALVREHAFELYHAARLYLRDPGSGAPGCAKGAQYGAGQCL